MISRIGNVIVRGDDQKHAKRFSTTCRGFELRRDESYGDARWIEVRPPDGGPLLQTPRATDEPTRELPVELPHSPVFFTCADVEAPYALGQSS